ncbi:MAG TPA: hypothetical protein VFF52_05860 [Isosphaeraceae bacterium]|nr:hypothetical protein [Isosphaeraceae bacterium]
MGSSRRWFGCTSGFASICAILFFTLPESERPRTAVRGHVTHNGHAVKGAAVAFAPVGEFAEYPSAPIDASGCFHVESVWQKEAHSREHYRIYLIPFRDQRPEFPIPARYTSPATSGLEVALGSEPTYLEIQLKD